ncbi:hypothetical protein [Nocardia sp. NPDC052566]|uniref:hypothetical protein n=1 Tax=Nocardia sp. NPDC052566 TaxID=3364330 RepID=UPI0037C959A2
MMVTLDDVLTGTGPLAVELMHKSRGSVESIPHAQDDCDVDGYRAELACDAFWAAVELCGGDLVAGDRLHRQMWAWSMRMVPPPCSDVLAALHAATGNAREMRRWAALAAAGFGKGGRWRAVAHGNACRLARYIADVDSELEATRGVQRRDVVGRAAAVLLICRGMRPFAVGHRPRHCRWRSEGA